LQELLASFAYGKVVHEGLTLAIVGRPNVGKSSLFNRLVERERAIVTATPGTTRDLVSETVSIGGIPVRLIDTAGIREALDEAESIGVRKSMEALADADIVLIVQDASRDGTDALTSQEQQQDVRLLRAAQGRHAIIVRNKIDLAPAVMAEPAESKTPSSADPVELPDSRLIVAASALTGAGIKELRCAVLQLIGGASAQPESGFLTNLRHQQLVTDALAALDRAGAAVPLQIPHEMILLDLYSTLRPLDDITGATTAEDILNLIFSSFCIGK